MKIILQQRMQHTTNSHYKVKHDIHITYHAISLNISKHCFIDRANKFCLLLDRRYRYCNRDPMGLAPGGNTSHRLYQLVSRGT